MYSVISANRAPNKAPKNWRIYEREMVEKYFGKVLDVNGEDGHSVLEAYEQYSDTVKYIRWFPSPENINGVEYNQMIQQSDRIGELPYIGSSAKGFINVQCKEEAFKVWKDNGIPVPEFFIFNTADEFYENYESSNIEFPFLIRLNNGVGGNNSFLIKDKSELDSSVNKLIEISKQPNDFGQIQMSCFCIQMIDTIDRHYNVNHSFRIHVSGDRVISGYARVSSPDDWVAITGKFNNQISEAWVAYNVICEELMREYEEVLCKSVRVLGLNVQGIDLILDREGQPYFLEVQPTYSSGYPQSFGNQCYKPPFWNPYQTDLVNFILQNESYIKKEMPMYYYNWLDKENHFQLVYKTLKEYLDVRS